MADRETPSTNPIIIIKLHQQNSEESDKFLTKSLKEIDIAAETDFRLFWKLLRIRHNKPLYRIHAIKCVLIANTKRTNVSFYTFKITSTIRLNISPAKYIKCLTPQ